MKKEAIRVSTTIPAAPTTLYLAWLNTEQHSAMTGAAAKFDTEVGGKYSSLNGYVSGKLVILDLGRRIVASWRTTDFGRDDPDSRVEIFLEAMGGSTRLTILHTDIPEGQGDKARDTWNEKYFGPMRNFFSKFLPDPRKPPPPRRPIPPEDEEEEEEVEEAPKKKSKIDIKPAKPSKVALKPTPKAAAAPKAPTRPPPPPVSTPKTKTAKPVPKAAAKAPPKAAPKKAESKKAESKKAAPKKAAPKKAGTKKK
jgi:uncharacterized protein YndB with AHSA1/START domain